MPSWPRMRWRRLTARHRREIASDSELQMANKEESCRGPLCPGRAAVRDGMGRHTGSPQVGDGDEALILLIPKAAALMIARRRMGPRQPLSCTSRASQWFVGSSTSHELKKRVAHARERLY